MMNAFGLEKMCKNTRNFKEFKKTEATEEARRFGNMVVKNDY